MPLKPPKTVAQSYYIINIIFCKYAENTHGFGFRKAGVILDDDLFTFFQILLSAFSIFSLSIMTSNRQRSKNKKT